jgi:hypothetical protein
MSEDNRSDSMPVMRQSLVELAVESWRLSQWILANPDHAKAPARRAAERLQSFLTELKLEIIDLTGKSFDPGLAVEVLGFSDGNAAELGSSVVDETVSPIVVYDGIVAKHGQVVLRRQQFAKCGEEA